MTISNNPKVIVSLDLNDFETTIALAKQFLPSQCRLKIGPILFTRYGPKIIEALLTLGFEIFLDLKFHDIPNTIAGAVAAACDLGVWMVNLHASAGSKAMQLARETISKHSHQPLLIAVTILTSFNERDIKKIGFNQSIPQLVLELAKQSQVAGADGVVCSANEVAMLKAQLNPEFCFVTPGIRLASDKQDDQQRSMTPQQALLAGSHYLVIGRPIIEANNPVQVLQMINTSISE